MFCRNPGSNVDTSFVHWVLFGLTVPLINDDVKQSSVKGYTHRFYTTLLVLVLVELQTGTEGTLYSFVRVSDCAVWIVESWKPYFMNDATDVKEKKQCVLRSFPLTQDG